MKADRKYQKNRNLYSDLPYNISCEVKSLFCAYYDIILAFGNWLKHMTKGCECFENTYK